MMTPTVRHAALTAHITSSVGWFGAVVAFFAMSVAGLTSPSQELVRAAYVAMELTGWFVIVPFCLATLATGLIQSLGTNWGLLRHNWVVAKLAIAVLATILLTLHMQPVSRVANVAATMSLSYGDLRQVRVQLVADAVLAMVALTIATILSVYKPQGLTPYGRRVSGASVAAEALPWSYVWAIAALLLVLLFAFVHLAGFGLRLGHGHM
jgi:hypothetical protein